MPEEQKYEEIKNNPYWIFNLFNPSSGLIKCAIDQFNTIHNDSMIIGDMLDTWPKLITEDILIYAVEKYRTAIEYIPNPSIRVMLAAVNADPYSISYIKHPPAMIQWVAAKKDYQIVPYLIKREDLAPSIKDWYNNLPGVIQLVETNNKSADPNTWSDEEQIKWVLENTRRFAKIKNPSVKVQMAVVEEFYDAIKYIKSPCLEIQLCAVKKDGRAIVYIKNPSLDVQLAAVQEFGDAIQYIKSPSLEIQLAAVQQNGSSIWFIINPSPLVQYAAIKQDPNSILYIKPHACIDPGLLEKYGCYLNESLTETKNKSADPNDWTEEQQIAFVEKKADNIKQLENPSILVQIAAIGKYKKARQYINNPAISVDPNDWTEEQQIALVERRGVYIGKIKNPSVSVQLAAVNKDCESLKYIENPSLEVQLVTVNKIGVAIKYIENPSLEVQLAAVNQNGVAIIYIENPSVEVQLAAVNQNGYIIDYIKNPSIGVQLAAVNQNGFAISKIPHPTPLIQSAACRQNYYSINYINPRSCIDPSLLEKYGEYLR